MAGKMILNEKEMDKVVGGLTADRLKYTEAQYAESGVFAEVISGGKSYSPDKFKNVRGYEVTFSMLDAAGTSHEVNPEIAEKAINYHKIYGSQLLYEDINNDFGDLC